MGKISEFNAQDHEVIARDFADLMEASRKRCADGRIVTDAIVPASVFNDADYADDFNIFLKLGLEPTNPEWKAHWSRKTCACDRSNKGIWNVY